MKLTPRISALFTTLFVAGLGILLAEAAVSADKNARKNTIFDILSLQATELSRRISTASLATSIIKEHVIRNNGVVSDFEKWADSVLTYVHDISSLQLAPKGVIEKIHPIEDDRNAIGHDLLNQDKHREDARRAIETNMITMSGPFTLVQGGIGVVVRNPVFLQVEDNQEFWGFVSSLIRVGKLFNELDDLVEFGYAYRVSRQRPGMADEVFWSSGSNARTDFDSIKIDLPDGMWSIGIASSAKTTLVFRFAGYVLSLFAAVFAGYLVFRVMSEPYKLSKLVNRQTRGLHKLAYVDALTGLPNFKYFARSLHKIINDGKGEGRCRMVVLLNIVTWNEVVETVGYQFGNEIIKAIGSRLSQQCPTAKYVTRCGDGVFILLYDQKKQGNCETVAQLNKLENLLAEPLLVHGAEILLNVSIGYAPIKKSDVSATEVIMRAEKALGGSRPFRLDYSLVESRAAKTVESDFSELVRDLSAAIHNNEFEIVYQPIVDARTGIVCKAEALLRWHHPRRGHVSPVEFIPIAEKTGLIHEIGDWVFKQVALASQTWRSAYHPDFQISVNVSPEQLTKRFFIDKWPAFLITHGISGQGLCIELTEGVLLAENTMLEAQLEKFRSMNIGLALDDFGTGYSSLFYLKRLNIELLKIDRSFVRNLSADNKDRILCKSILSIAAKLKVKVVAEGVEDEYQREFLCREGCDYLQGYLFSKPVSRSEFEGIAVNAL